MNFIDIQIESAESQVIAKCTCGQHADQEAAGGQQTWKPLRAPPCDWPHIHAHTHRGECTRVIAHPLHTCHCTSIQQFVDFEQMDGILTAGTLVFVMSILLCQQFVHSYWHCNIPSRGQLCHGAPTMCGYFSHFQLGALLNNAAVNVLYVFSGRHVYACL